MAATTSPRRVLALLIATTAMGVLTFSLATPALPDLADELGVSRGAIGLVQGAVAIPGVFLAVMIGYLADRFGRRSVIQGSLLVFGLAGVAAYFARSFWPLVVLRGVQGLGTSGLLSLGVVIIGDLFEGPQRRWAIGVNATAITVTAMVAPSIGGILASGDPFRPFLVYGLALPLIVWATVLPGRPEGTVMARPLAHLRGMMSALRAGGRYTDFMGLLPFSAVAMIVFMGFGFTTTPLFLESEFRLSAAERGLMLSITSIGSTVTSMSAGRLARRFAGGQIMSGAMTLVLLGFIGMAISPSLVYLGFALVVLGLGLGALFPLFQDLAASAGPAQYRGALVGTWVSSIRLGQSIGPVVASALAVGIGERTSYWLAAGVMAAMVIGWRPIRRLAGAWTRSRSPDGYPRLAA